MYSRIISAAVLTTLSILTVPSYAQTDPVVKVIGVSPPHHYGSNQLVFHIKLDTTITCGAGTTDTIWMNLGMDNSSFNGSDVVIKHSAFVNAAQKELYVEFKSNRMQWNSAMGCSFNPQFDYSSYADYPWMIYYQ